MLTKHVGLLLRKYVEVEVNTAWWESCAMLTVDCQQMRKSTKGLIRGVKCCISSWTAETWSVDLKYIYSQRQVFRDKAVEDRQDVTSSHLMGNDSLTLTHCFHWALAAHIPSGHKKNMADSSLRASNSTPGGKVSLPDRFSFVRREELVSLWLLRFLFFCTTIGTAEIMEVSAWCHWVSPARSSVLSNKGHLISLPLRRESSE